MIPQEILSQLSPDFPVSDVKFVRLSASPTSSLGETYLLAASGRLKLFIRDSLSGPLAEVLMQSPPRLIEESFDTFLCITKITGEECKIKVSFLEKDGLEATLKSITALTPPKTATPLAAVALVPTPPTTATSSVIVAPAPLTLSIENPPVPPEPIVAEIVALPTPQDLAQEEREEQKNDLEIAVETAIRNGDLPTATKGLASLCNLPLDTDILEEHRRGLASLEALQRGDLKAAFFLAGDYENFYFDFQDALASHFGDKFKEAGEKLLAAAAYSATESETSEELLTELSLTEAQLRQKYIEEALLFLRGHINQNPQDDLSLSTMVALLSENDHNEEALDLAKQIIALAPSRYDGYQQVVRLSLALTKTAEALEVARDAVALFPQMYWAHVLLGEVAEAKHDPAQGKQAFQEALRLYEGDLTAIEGLSKILRSQQDHQALAAHLERSFEHLSYQEEQVSEELAQLYEGPLKNPQKAKEFRRRVKASDGSSPAEKKAPVGVGGTSILGWVIFLFIAILFIWLR
jgi:hypothetical protein